jgi:predicted nucleic acid-binding protein
MTAWLLDTGPLVAFFDRSDADHEWAKEQWAHAPGPMLTCEAVLSTASLTP